MRIRVSVEADVARAVMIAARTASQAGFDDTDRTMLSTAVSELARNILKYAGSGDVTVSALPGPGVEVVASDKGPGIADLDRALEEHYSTGGTLGLGLPGVRRLMDEFDIVSSPGSGTRVTVRKWGRGVARKSVQGEARPRAAPALARSGGGSPAQTRPGAEPRRLEAAATMRPCAGHRTGGDVAVIRHEGGRTMAVIVDVLGHGGEAHEVAVVVEGFFERVAFAPPVELMQALDGQLRGSRGAAAGIAMLELDAGLLRYAGIGNTVLRRFGAGEGRLLSRPGIVGGLSRAPREERLQAAPGDVILMYTDGVREHFAMDEYPRILGHAAAVIARTVVRRFGKQHDDAACLALRVER